jgi:hypothetical protein
MLAEGDTEAAESHLDEAVAVAREAQLPWALVRCLQVRAEAATAGGDQVGAQALLDESLALARAKADKPAMAGSLFHLGRLARDQRTRNVPAPSNTRHWPSSPQSGTPPGQPTRWRPWPVWSRWMGGASRPPASSAQPSPCAWLVVPPARPSWGLATRPTAAWCDRRWSLRSWKMPGLRERLCPVTRLWRWPPGVGRPGQARQWLGQPDPHRAPGRRPGGRRTHQQGDRRTPVRLAPNRAGPPASGLPQARHQLPPPAARRT